MDHAQNQCNNFHSPSPTPLRVGCVSYLNAKPLIAGLAESHPQLQVRCDVPSGLLTDLLTGQVDIALCPVVDYYRSHCPLKIVPCGGISSKGHTLTVCLFSRTPIEELTEIHADTDSHTSVNLLRVIMAKRYQRAVKIIPYDTRCDQTSSKPAPDAMLLIGDKVVTSSPLAVQYPYQLDMGQAWTQLTHLPFMFAIWLAKEDANLGELPLWLAENRKHNQARCAELAREFAPQHGWPQRLAYEYLTENLHYEVGDNELQAMELFAQYLHELNLIDKPCPLAFYTQRV